MTTIARGAVKFFLAVSILALAYTFMRSEIVNHGEKHHYFKYYMGSIVAIFFFGYVSRLKDEIQLNIAMVMTSLLMGLYLVEICLFALNPIGGSKAVASRVAGVEFDMRTKYQVIQDLKNRGVDAVPSIPAFNHYLKGNGGGG